MSRGDSDGSAGAHKVVHRIARVFTCTATAASVHASERSRACRTPCQLCVAHRAEAASSGTSPSHHGKASDHLLLRRIRHDLGCAARAEIIAARHRRIGACVALECRVGHGALQSDLSPLGLENSRGIRRRSSVGNARVCGPELSGLTCVAARYIWPASMRPAAFGVETAAGHQGGNPSPRPNL